LAAGYKHHLTKPFLPEDLDALLASAAAQLRQNS
jgi:CheY-like chemotaxis protein